MQALSVRRVCVRDGFLDCEVAVAISQFVVSEKTAARVLSLLPNLANHVCVNDGVGPVFGDEIVGTELAHVLEHVVIELQGQAYQGLKPDARFVGHTSWLDELAHTRFLGIAMMRVTVSFACDVACLQAIKEGLAILKWACVGADDDIAPDISEALQRIRALA